MLENLDIGHFSHEPIIATVNSEDGGKTPQTNHIMQVMQKEINSVSTLAADQQNSMMLVEQSNILTTDDQDNLKAGDSLYEVYGDTSEDVAKLQQM